MAMEMVVLPGDIIEQILSRLPFKSLRRFRCLSRSCETLISTQSFARKHINRASQSPKSSSQKILVSYNSCLVSLDSEKEDSETAMSRLDFPPKSPHIDPIVVGSCHGLICLALEDVKDFYVWNPSTGEYKKLPDPCFPDAKGIAYGFGYDSFSDDYKVVIGFQRHNYLHGKYEEEVAIFSMRENCWRIIQQLPPCRLLLHGLYPDKRYGSFVNGTLNWLVGWFDHVKLELVFAVVAFDLKTERFFDLPMPERDPPSFDITMAVLDGRLGLSFYRHAADQPSSFSGFELWVMNEYGEGKSWTRLLDPPFDQVKCRNHFPLCTSKDNLMGNVEGRKCNLCYHSCINPSEAVVYLEGLISPNAISTFNTPTSHAESESESGRLRKRKKME